MNKVLAIIGLLWCRWYISFWDLLYRSPNQQALVLQFGNPVGVERIGSENKMPLLECLVFR